MAVAVRVDAKGRVVLPRAVRKELGIEPGDTLFVQHEAGVVQLAKGENPFDELARHAVKEYRQGKTWRLREFAHEEGISLTDGE